ncbi:hypothetical protein QWY97_04060 [Vibrio cortegadensis]|uniref:hypothetical protein n=1 Tax=Vibrio cortegadensis TaxID=1328770 RepID=UPI0021C40F5D|nr:hypothetical protein [Vibrio cortegadensis]MDN3696524.1 hypothetical protein [Vibrio cortegadensis]
MQVNGYLQPISPFIQEPATKQEFNRLLDSCSKTLFQNSNHNYIDAELYKLQNRKYSSLTVYQKVLIESLLRSNDQVDFRPEVLQTDLVSQLQQAKRARLDYFQIHAFRLNLSIFFQIFKGNLFIYDIADTSEKGLKSISEVYNIKALDSLVMRRQLNCAQLIRADKFDSKLNQLVKHIWKAGFTFFHFSFSDESMNNLSQKLMEHPDYVDRDPMFGICFEKQ